MVEYFDLRLPWHSGRQLGQLGRAPPTDLLQWPVLDRISHLVKKLHPGLIQCFHDTVERMVGFLLTQRLTTEFSCAISMS